MTSVVESLTRHPADTLVILIILSAKQAKPEEFHNAIVVHFDPVIFYFCLRVLSCS